MTKTTAQFLSTVGHPFVMLPAVFVSLSVRQVGFEKAWPVLAAVLGSLAALGAFVLVRKKKGLVTNLDVSAQHQRARNVYQPIMVLVLIVAAALYFFRQPFVGDALFFGLLMAACYAINVKIKISQHTVIATFVSCLVIAAHLWAGWVLLMFALCVGWSRVALGRHQTHEVVAGALVGILFGVAHGWLLG
jgi:membrane-associated phospholipid phosphatase